jgi:pilus assembly protein CpaC
MVQVRVRIAQLNHEMLRSYGMDLGVIFNDARNIVNSGMAATPVLSGVFDNGRVGVLLDALVQNGTGKIVEDATLVTLAGNPAAFLAGGEFAVPTTVGIGGAAASTTSFRGFGTSVIATPTIVNNDLFRLQIVTELSNINSGNAVGGIPGLNVKRVQTLVEFREGQTLVLGGMFGRTQRAEVTRIPLLGELPIVGSFLFNSKRATEDETELLIVVTPELVRAIDADQQPPMPGYYVTHPDCFDFYKYNRTEGNPNMGHYQMLPFGHGQDYAQDVGYNVFNPGPAPGGIAPQGYGPPPTQGLPPQQQQQGYGAPPVDPGYNQPGPSYPQQGVPAGLPPGPQYGPGPGQAAPQYPPSNPQPVPQAQPTPAGPAQSMFRSSRVPVQQTSAVRGVPRTSANRGMLQR